MTTEFDDLFELDHVHAVERASSQTTALYASQEILDRMFSPYASVPMNSDVSSNADELLKVAKGQKASTGTGKPVVTTTPVRRVTPRVELRDPLGEFNDDGMTKLLKTESLPTDHLYHNRHFPTVLDMVTKFTGHPQIRKRIHDGNREQVREAEARVIVSILEHLETTTEDVRAGRL